MSRPVALEVLEHLRGCPSCAEEAEELARVVSVLRAETAPAPVLPDDFADRVLDALPGRGGGGAARTVGGLAVAFALGVGAAALAGRGAPATATTSPTSSTPAPRVVTEPAPAPRVVEPAPRVVEPAPRVDEPAPAPDDVQAGTWQPVTPHTPVLTRAPAGAPPLERYVVEANLVLEAVSALDQPDPHWLEVLSKHVDETALLDQGDRLLVALRRTPDRDQADALRPLIDATQVVLRKVRHAPDQDAGTALTTLRADLRETGLLDAYRALLEQVAREPARPAQVPTTTTPGVTDPL
jgi:hypothetical protein